MTDIQYISDSVSHIQEHVAVSYASRPSDGVLQQCPSTVVIVARESKFSRPMQVVSEEMAVFAEYSQIGLCYVSQIPIVQVMDVQILAASANSASVFIQSLFRSLQGPIFGLEIFCIFRIQIINPKPRKKIHKESKVLTLAIACVNSQPALTILGVLLVGLERVRSIGGQPIATGFVKEHTHRIIIN